jgi:hypothetical protein
MSDTTELERRDAAVTPALTAIVADGSAVGFVNPRTGSVVKADSPPDELGDYLELVRHVVAELGEVDRQVSSWIVAQMDKRVSWTLDAAGVKLSSSSPQADPVYDLEKLRGVLHRLVRQGAISGEAADACIVQKPAPPAPPPEVSKSAVAKLVKLGPHVAKAIDRAVIRRAGDGERKVKVTPR